MSAQFTNTHTYPHNHTNNTHIARNTENCHTVLNSGRKKIYR